MIILDYLDGFSLITQILKCREPFLSVGLQSEKDVILEEDSKRKMFLALRIEEGHKSGNVDYL